MEGGSLSKVIMGATMVMAASLAIVVVLLFVLLAELYCSLFLHRRSLRAATAPASAGITTGGDDSSASRLGRLYAQGVIAAPRSLLFPPVAGKQNRAETEVRTQEPNTTSSPPAAGHLVYISNPVFDACVEETPFQTPATSPSRLESGSSTGDEDKYPMTPPLTPMKKLPEKACSVSLSSANSKMGLSSSSSSSPSTSPSW